MPIVGTRFHDSTPQSLYYLLGHEKEGLFKGMVMILQERGFNVNNLLAECPNFKYAPSANGYCLSVHLVLIVVTTAIYYTMSLTLLLLNHS